ncbi:MAG: class I SAM-dependent methyltransferase [Alphaproteobacteria bacterium]|nr:class I SAM-dependent methyltransferase [Alphaproteobacteria bacterium]
MTAWKSKNITDSYTKTKEFRFNNYVVTPHVMDTIGNVDGKALLDIGCGFGRYLELFSKQNPLKLVGCDISNHQIEVCKKALKDKNIKYYVLDFLDSDTPTTLGQNEYDIVYSIFVILYIDNLEKLQIFIENSYKCLKKGGKFLICTLDISSASAYPEVFEILKYPTKPLTEDGKYIDGCPVETGLTEDCILTTYHRNFSTLKKLMETAGFKDIKKSDIFLDEIALQAFTKKELDIIKKSNILSLIEAEK